MATQIHKPAGQSIIQNIGGKIKTGVEIVGAIKGIYDIGKGIYGAIRAAAPIVTSIAAML